MIYVGLDDTDTLDSPGTNQLAKAIVRQLADRFRCVMIIRHQLLDDPRVPYTSKNGSASILLEPTVRTNSVSENAICEELFAEFRAGLKERFVTGSDPGLCLAMEVPGEIAEYGRRCQKELMPQTTARELAAKYRIRLEGLGGTEDGVIGALAAIGLAATANDGRIVQLGTWPDDLAGPEPIDVLHSRSVDVRCLETNEAIREGVVDVGKHLRPNYRNGRAVLFVKPADQNGADYGSVRLT